MVHLPMFLAGTLGGWEWLVILVIALLLFGHKIPGMARNLGRGVSEFKQGLREGQDEEAKAAASRASSPAPSEKTESKT
jgi:sec-independent protein translocase protein TatA